MADTNTAPAPGETLHDESGNVCWWLASAYSKQDILDEWDWLEITADDLHEDWNACRWTTLEERANEDWIYDNFGDVEMNPTDTSVVYWRCKPDTPGAHPYWTTEPVAAAPREQQDTKGPTDG